MKMKQRTLNASMGAGLCGGFNHNSKLKAIKFKEAMNGPDSDK